MLKHRLYYAIKPLLPWSLRILARRIRARRIARHCAPIWPINPATATPPADWGGWPSGKQFAFVLTHDVEGRTGLARCRELADCEARLGFRSSFNFIPEGEYEATPALRAELHRRGFEVGVHDLHHDGSLYKNRERFQRCAKKINTYLRDWNAVGFRSGFMYHNLDWLHDLEAQYDASTFDTDPFEPQPDAANTIFPFWVPGAGGPAREGYVELPYTLSQDSSLFIILQQRSNAIWKEKLDWIAERGGMALVNVHPDYLHIKSHRQAKQTILDHYLEFLQYVKTRYENAYWHALPREVAALVRERQQRPATVPITP